jgi:outer membrane lipoprotein LolB
MRVVLWVVMLLLPAACAQFETQAPQDLEFELVGRLAARYGSESFSGNLNWRHARNADEMLITSPIGAGIARIVREGHSVVLTTAEPREYKASDAEALTDEVLGFRVPLAGLADWVRARPSDKAAAKTEYGDDGRLRSLEQLGWTIEYQAYEGKLPSRMRLAYPGIELRLAISQWK